MIALIILIASARDRRPLLTKYSLILAGMVLGSTVAIASLVISRFADYALGRLLQTLEMVGSTAVISESAPDGRRLKTVLLPSLGSLARLSKKRRLARWTC